MNDNTMINLMETDRLLCDGCYVDLQDDDMGDFNPNLWLHARIPWHPNGVCWCCGATHPNRAHLISNGPDDDHIIPHDPSTIPA
jgi:hypothetical protein